MMPHKQKTTVGKDGVDFSKYNMPNAKEVDIDSVAEMDNNMENNTKKVQD